MSEHPILFSTPMVHAILEGRKTQTRRVVKPQPDDTRARGKAVTKAADYCTGSADKGQAYYWHDGACWNSSEPFKCPYGKPGDRLWVRETWGFVSENGYANGPSTLSYFADRAQRSVERELVMLLPHTQRPKLPGDEHWRPSIHMPRWASRITLEVTRVRAERLQEITPRDVHAEGIECAYIGPIDEEFGGKNYLGPEDYFAEVWNSLNAKRGHGWETNPWVWVIEFELAKWEVR